MSHDSLYPIWPAAMSVAIICGKEIDKMNDSFTPYAENYRVITRVCNQQCHWPSHYRIGLDV